MTNLFLSVVEITLGTSLVVLMLLLLLPLTAKFFKRKFRYWAWLILALRLIIPFSFTQTPMVEVQIPSREIVLVTQPAEQVTPPLTEQNETVTVPDDTTFEDTAIVTPPAVTQSPSVYVRPTEQKPDTPSQTTKTIPVLSVMGYVWAFGFLCVFLTQISFYLHFSSKTRRFSIPVSDEIVLGAIDKIKSELGIKRKVRVFKNAKVHSPLLIGFFNPAVLIPKKIENEGDILMILRHELMHLKRADTWYKLLLSLTCAIHWFNPLVWIMKKVADEDLENACDEDVVKNQNEEFRHNYCESILRAIRSQKSREPIFTTGFSSKPSAIRARFIRILDMTKKRAGKPVLAVLLCLTILCGTFIGCDLAGDIIGTVSGETSSNNEKIPHKADLNAVVEKEMSLNLSDDAQVMLEVMKYYNYETCDLIVEKNVFYEDKTEFLSGEIEYYTVVNKHALFKMHCKNGADTILLMKVDVTYYHENGLITSNTANTINFYAMNISDELNFSHLDGAEIITTSKGGKACVYLPKTKTMLMGLYDSGNFLLNVKGQDKNNPLFIQNKLLYGQFDRILKNYNDQIIEVTNFEGDKFIAYYDSTKGTISLFGDTPVAKTNFGEYANLLSDGEDKFTLSLKDRISFFDMSSETPFTPYATIGGKDIGGEVDESSIMIMRAINSDRNDANRYVALYKNNDDNHIGFITFDRNGNLLNSHAFTDKFVEDDDDLYAPILVDNVMYFTLITEEYLSRAYRKYAVDVRKGTDKTLQLQSENIVDVVGNLKPEDFDYSRSGKMYPFTLGKNTKVIYNEGLSDVGDEDANNYSYWFSKVEYDADTHNLTAIADSALSKENMVHIKGKLLDYQGIFYFQPENLEGLPKPYDNFTVYENPTLVKFATDNSKELYNYIQSLNLNYNDVTIGFDQLLIERKNNIISYTVELEEIYNGSDDYVSRQKKGLEILKTLGIVSEGAFQIKTNYNDWGTKTNTEWTTPTLKTAPFSLFHNFGFDNTENIVGWYIYQTEKEDFEKLSFADMKRNTGRFKRQYDIPAENVEGFAAKYFDVDVNTLRNDSSYNSERHVYAVDFTGNWNYTQIYNMYMFEMKWIGNTVQFAIYSDTTQKSHHVVAELFDDGSYKFLENSEFYKFDIPECFESEQFNW